MGVRTKVAIIEPVGGHGGMNYYDFGLANGLVQADCDVKVYTCDKTSPPRNSAFGCELNFVRIYGADHVAIRALRFVRGYVKSLASVIRWGGNIVHFHFFHCGSLEWLMITLSKAVGRKVVVTVHDVESFSGGHSKERSLAILSKADALIAHNEVSRSELIERIGVDPLRVAVIPHGNYLDFATGAVDSTVAKRRLGLPDEIPVLLFFGQIKEVKGLEIALEAVAELKKTGLDFRFVIAGKIWKDSFEKYQKLIDELGIGDVVISDIRYIPDDEALLFYSAADVVVLPYKKIYQSGVLLMAMSLKAPVVVSDLPGMCEIVRNGENGFVFESESSQSLASVLNQVLTKPHLLNRARDAAFEDMNSKYSWRQIGAETAALFRSLIIEK